MPTERLLAVIRALSFCRTRVDILACLRQHARQLTGADGVTFVLRDGDQCFYVEEDAIAPLWKGRRFPMDACISGWVMRTRQVAVIGDIYADRRIPVDAYRPTFVKSLAMVPVRDTDPLGAIGAYWASNHVATAEQVRVMQVIADASALALENARLYESLQSALEHAEALNRAKDEWLSVVSHELRTPLTPILGWARMLSKGQVGPDKLDHACKVIERNAVSEIRIVDDLLDVSRLMTGRLQLSREPMDARRVAAAAVDNIRASAAQKGVELAVSQPDGPLVVLGDARRLEQAVVHLLTNAVKFTPAGGRVSLELGEVGPDVRIRVSDTGAGLAQDAIAGLFQAFGQSDQSISRARGGLGLGLYLVRRIIELHGGAVSASSDGAGRGATFVIALPVHETVTAPEGAADAAVEDTPDLTGLHVLVVDDDRDTLDVVQQGLARCGARVDTAAGADQAIASCRVTQFDAVVSDLAMPEQDGYDLLARLRALTPGRASTPAIALTAHATTDDERRALAAGFRSYLAKPVTMSRLAGSIQTALAETARPEPVK